MALYLLPAGAAEGYALIQDNIIANLGGLANDHAHTVVDKEPLANFSTRVDFNASAKPTDVRNEAREKGDTPPVEGMG
jgi:hypothetical protein